jgi:Tol biopolymer transport system component
VDYTRDGKWLVYASYPDRTLWKIRSDGTGNTQLTFPPMKAMQPHWSPSGDQIAFMGQLPGRSTLLYIVSESGGALDQPTERATGLVTRASP